jgi:glycerophosphoryl diester phosphodiesterase
MLPEKVIAHRGASAYAPENTMASFDLAVRQGAGCIEHDLHVSSDGVLVCIHDQTLDRTTNVAELFPRRGRDVREGTRVVRHWFVHDFTLAEIQELDAGSWFAPAFAGARVPVFEDLLDWARSRVAVLTELKDPDAYEALGVDILALFADALRRRGLQTGTADPQVTVQSFHEPTVRRAGAAFGTRLPVVLLIEPADATGWYDRKRVLATAAFASGIGPGKRIVGARPELVQWAHQAGLRVTPWTFKTGDTAPFETVRTEMSHYLFELDVDAVITNNPDECQPEGT